MTDAVLAAPTEVAAHRFRDVMGRFATGIAVVTTPTPDGVHGMTATSFVSVSLEPPLVLISLGCCRMATMLHRTGRYGVSVLAEDQMVLSRHFAGRRVAGLRTAFSWHAGTPFLTDAIAHIGGTVVDSHAAGDHTLFIAQVEHVWHREGPPLVFFTGAFKTLRVGLTDDPFFL